MVVAALALPGATPLQGGLPILYEGKVIGAIGVSGDTPQEDEDIARVGAAAFKWAGMVKRIGWAAVAVVGAVIIATPTDAGVSAPAPEITASTWFNSPPKAIADLRSKVALVEFWTFGCYNCRNVEPHVKELRPQVRGARLSRHRRPYSRNRLRADVDNVRRYVHDPVGLPANHRCLQRPRTPVSVLRWTWRIEANGPADYPGNRATIRRTRRWRPVMPIVAAFASRPF